jgi:glutathione S-transferase
MSVKPATLVTISFSHFCEKGRWALDRGAIPYREELHAPVVHLLGTLPRGGRSTPLLALPDGTVLKSSRELLHHVDAQRPGLLYPKEPALRAEVDALEARFDDELGPATRRLAYHAIFGANESIGPMLDATTQGLSRALSPLLSRVLPGMLSRALKIDDTGAQRSREKLAPLLDELDRMLRDGRRYLVGDRFTAADLTFAALYSPLLFPDEQPITSKVPAPLSLEKLRAEHAARPAGALALRLYRDERRVVLPS